MLEHLIHSISYSIAVYTLIGASVIALSMILREELFVPMNMLWKKE